MSTISTIGAMALDQARLRERLDALSRQISSGQRAATHGALGSQARFAIDLRGDIARREAYVAAADTALGRASATQNVLARLEEIATSTAAEATRARTLGATGVEALASIARSALEEVAALLNSSQGGEYLFSGSDVASLPVPNASGIATGALAGAIAAAVGTLDPTNAAAVLASAGAAVTSPLTSPFNAHLEGAALTESRRALQAADGERISWGVIPSQDRDGDVAESWGRELLRGLAVLASLTPASASQGAGYDALLDGTVQVLSGAGRSLAQERGALGAAERRIEAARERHEDMLVLVRAQLGSLEGTDLAQASVSLSEMQLRLQASYETTASIARLSLASLLR